MKRIFFISIIGLALFSGACSKKNNPAAEQYQKAEELYRQGDYARAKVAIDSIAKIDSCRNAIDAPCGFEYK